MHDLIKVSRSLRKRQTDAESLLWRHLRRKQLVGLKFRRQHPIGKCIVDFVCLEKQLILEIDGGQHAIEINEDRDRDQWLLAEGYKVLRFWNNEVLQNLEGVVEAIRANCFGHPPLTPPIKGGEND